MNILYTNEGKILACGNINQITQQFNTFLVIVEDINIPSDFINTFALGKYKIQNNVIAAVESWVAPETNSLSGIF